MMPAAPPPDPDVPAEPGWTITGALLFWKDGMATHAVQSPFTWTGAAWVANVQITRTNLHTSRVLEGQLLVAPETLQRWQEAGLVPAFEATRQVQAHLLRYGWQLTDLGTIPLS